MLLTMCKAKIHRIKVTSTNLNYVGSVEIDEDLLDQAGIYPFEQVHTINLSNGNRHVTYALPGKRGSGACCPNGAGALLNKPGDMIIILTYGQIDEKEAKNFKIKTVMVDENNKFKKLVHGLQERNPQC